MRLSYKIIQVGFAAAMMASSGIVAAAPSIDGTPTSKAAHAPHSYFQTVQGKGVRDDIREDSRAIRDDMRERAKNRRDGAREKLQDLPPEKQAELMRRRAEIEKELEGLPPEERAARIKEMREEWAEKQKNRREERTQELEDRWNEASPEAREIFCDNVAKKCAEEGGFVCDTAKSRCSE